MKPLDGKCGGNLIGDRFRCRSTKCHSPCALHLLLNTVETQTLASNPDGARFYLSPAGRGGAISCHPHTRVGLKPRDEKILHQCRLKAVNAPWLRIAREVWQKYLDVTVRFEDQGREDVHVLRMVRYLTAGAFPPNPPKVVHLRCPSSPDHERLTSSGSN